MATEGPKSVATFFLFVNLLIYAVLVVVAGWALNYGIDETPQSGKVPARLFPIYYPIGNLATGFFVIFALIAGLVGVAASLTGLQNVVQGNASGFYSAASSSLIAWGLTVLNRDNQTDQLASNLLQRTLETLTIMVSGTQLLCTGAIHAGLASPINQAHLTGRI